MQEREKILVSELKKGSYKAFELLYNQYKSKIFNFIRKSIYSQAETEDLVQNLFINIWEAKENLDPEKSFSSYLFTSAKNMIFNHIRKAINAETYKRELISKEEFNETTFKQVVFSELEQKYNKLIDELPPKRKEIFILAKKEGLSYKKIAEKLNISENTVDTQMRAALKYIRTNLKDYLKVLLLVMGGF